MSRVAVVGAAGIIGPAIVATLAECEEWGWRTYIPVQKRKKRAWADLLTLTERLDRPDRPV